jgi:hypothetical protein
MYDRRDSLCFKITECEINNPWEFNVIVSASWLKRIFIQMKLDGDRALENSKFK